MNFMETLKFKPQDAVTYDGEAFLKSCEEDVKQRLEEANEKLEIAEIETKKVEAKQKEFEQINKNSKKRKFQ